MDPFIKQDLESYKRAGINIDIEGEWSKLGDYDFYFSEDERARRIYSENKYVLYHYTSLDTARKIIASNSLRFSDPEDFNDPFDLNLDLLDFNCSLEESVDFFCRFFPINREEYTKRLTHTVSSDPDFIRKNGIQMLKDVKEDLGIACFSDEHDNALMWSHYADRHKGVCLGINIGSTEKYNIMPMNYIHEVIKLNFYKHLTPNLHLLYIWLHYKSHIWEYEREIRAICPSVSKYCDSPNRLIAFPKEDLKEIYFGLRTSDKDLQGVEQLLVENNYGVEGIRKEKMAINPKTYSFKK